MIINHNMASLNTYRQLSTNNANSAKSLEKLSSGLRINKAGDDAAGLAISEKMRGQIRGLDQAARNSQDAISMIQTAEGSLSETHSILQRMRELAVQGGNDTNTSTDRGEIQKELNSLTTEINRIGNTTEFNSQKLLNATSGAVTAAAPAVAPGQVTVGGFTFDFSGGDALNGWIVETGTVADGTAASASLDTTNKKIIINGDFDNTDTLATYVLAADLKTAIDTALSGGGFTQTATVGGTATAGTASGAASAALAGGVAATVAKSSFSMQIGANENQTMTLDFTDMRSAALAITGSAGAAGFTATNTVTDGTNDTANEAALDLSTSANAGNAVTVIQAALEKVSAERSKLGANSNRLEHTITNLGTSSENMTAAESRIRDVDMAKEMMNFQKNNILSQAATAMLAQANQAPQGVLQLLR
ncbi:flagellin [Desulfosporosinus burensis]